MQKHRKDGDFSRLLRLILAFVALTSVFFYSTRAEAAEWVVLKYSFLREKVSVPELVTFVTTGELSSSLKTYLKIANKEPEELRRVLTQELKVNPTLLYSALNTPLGEGMLDRVSEVIHTPSNRANRESLRGALVSSALPDGNITLIESLQNYPTTEVHVEGDRVAEVMDKIRSVLNRLPRVGS